MKNAFFVLLLLSGSLQAQDSVSLSLQEAREMARENYPLIKQRDLIRQTAELSISNISKGYMPQLSLNGQATYQSDVTKVPVSIPGLNIAVPDKDQYKIVAEANQLIFDGGGIKFQKENQKLNEDVELMEVEVELYKVKERINQLFLGILLVDEQIKQAALVKADLNTGIKTTEARVINGVAFKSNLNTLKAELLKAEQTIIQLKATRKGLLETLGIFINHSLPETVKLDSPQVIDFAGQANEIQRPEIKLFTAKQNFIANQSKLVTAKNFPKASLFVQGGYGRPGLNLLDNSFDFYYIGGVRLNWPLSGLYTRKKEKQLIDVNKHTVAVQKDIFLLNTNASLKTQASEIDKLQQLIATDKNIIELRKSVKDAAQAQLTNGVITVNDFLQEVNAEDQARQSLIAHEVQLLQAKINYNEIIGK